MVKCQFSLIYIFIYFSGAIAPSATHYSSSTSSHKMIDVNCTGTETSIINCPYNGYTSYSCSIGRDANVFCGKCAFENLLYLSFIIIAIGVSSGNCTAGSVRLVGGSNQYEGRVEVCVNQAWSSVCTYSGWNKKSAKIICNQVGDNLSMHNVSHIIYPICILVNINYGTVDKFGFPQGSGRVLLGYFSCDGDEANLLECSPNYLYMYAYGYCQHSHYYRKYYDAAVICEGDCSHNFLHILHVIE